MRSDYFTKFQGQESGLESCFGSLTLESKKDDNERNQNVDSKFACQECEKQYTQFGRLQLHLKQKHGIADEAVLKCDNCDKFFDTVKRLNRHKKGCK